VQRVFEYGDHWLHRRRDTPIWHIYWYRPGSRRIGRRTTGTSDFEQAKRVLIEFADQVRQESRTSAAPSISGVDSQVCTPTRPPDASITAPLSSVTLLDVLCAYVRRLEGRPSHATACYVLRGWMEFCAHANVVYVHEMTLGMQERFVAWKRPSRTSGLPVSNGTVNRFLDILRAAFLGAWRRGELASYPHIRLLPQPAPRDRFLTEDEVRRLLDACREPHLYLFVLLGLHTLQRPSAILSLRTEQVDLQWNLINFTQPGKVVTNKRRASVPITATLRPSLEHALRISRSGHVIEVGGEPVKSVRRSFQTACRRAKIVGASPVTLRHTGATLLAAAGVPLREVSGMLGHTTSRITEQVYAKRRPEFLATAAKALDQLFPGGTAVDASTRKAA
jgi:integrase